MLCFVELAILVAGVAILISVLANGSLPMGKKELRGAPAYLVALLLMAPLPINLVIGCGLGVDAVQKGKQAPDIDETKLALIEIGVTALFVIPAIIIGLVGAKKKKKKKKRRPVDDRYEDERDDYDDRPRRRFDDDEDEEDRPRRRRSGDYDDEADDDRPRRRRDEFDDDDDLRPRRRRDED
jgi:hypothetical protein